MAVLPFETADVLLSIKQAAHITERHIDTTQFLHKSKFRRSFNLTATLGLLSRRTWFCRPDVELIEKGWSPSHGEYYLYVFAVGKNIGRDPWGFECKQIAIFYSYKPSLIDKFQIVTTYPHSKCYDGFINSRKPYRFLLKEQSGKPTNGSIRSHHLLRKVITKF